MTPRNQGDPKVEQILEVISKFSTGDFQARATPSKHEDSLDVIIRALNVLGEKLSSQGVPHLVDQRRVDEMLDVVIALARLDFSKEVSIPESKEDSLGALGIGLNMLSEELSRSHKTLLVFEKAFRTTMVGVTIRDCNNRIIYANPADVTMHGYDNVADLKNKDASIYGVPDAAQPLTLEKIERMEGWSRESVNVRKDGSRFPVHLTSDVIKDEKGAPVGVVTICEDITERKVAEEKLRNANRELQEAVCQLIQAEKLTALGELAASVTHEINQPLNGIKMTAQALLRYLDSYDRTEIAKELQEVVDLTRSMATIVDHLRRFTRPSCGTVMSPVDINAAIDAALRLTTQHLKCHNIELVRHHSKELPHVFGDLGRLEQAILNLVINARNALEDSETKGKRIEIRTYARQTGHPSVQGVLVLEIKDNGIGIPEDLRERVFSSFFTTKGPGKGTGLGLSIVHRIVQEHKGEIELESEVGKGTLFRITLPLHESGPREE